MAPKKKKLSKKEKQRLADEYEKLQKAQAEQERLKQLKEEKERLEKERKLAKEKAKREVGEQEIRKQQLIVSCKFLADLNSKIREVEEEKQAKEEWQKYMKCDGRPDPASFSQMNTYLYLWTRDDSTNNIENVLIKTDEVIQLLNVMDQLILDSPPGTPSSHIKEWKEIRRNMRLEQQGHIDTATYRLLRNIEQNLTPIDLTASKLLITCTYFTMSLWAGIPVPVSASVANETKQGMTVEFADLGVGCSLPPGVARNDMAIRALWLRYDHWSDLCPSFDCPACPFEDKDLLQATLEEWEAKCEAQASREEEYEAKRKEKKSAAELLEMNKPASDIVAAKEEEEAQHLKDELMKDTGPHQVNLRKYCILGGVLFVDLLEQPPQPRDLGGKYTVTILNTPPGLNPIDYYEHYVPPPPPEPGVRRAPEEIEVEVKKHEEALEKIGSMTIKLPESVLWFESPLAANWDPVNQYWSTEEIHDVKFNEDKQTLQFRSGRMGLMALVAYRYPNLPYQSWDLRPDFKGPPGGVVLTITASVVILEFIIREDKICLSQLQNGATAALQDIVGIFYPPRQLIRMLQTGGVDVFPPPDAVCYVAGSISKHRVAEDHLYHCMAIFATCYNFAWSRWNLLAGRRNMVLQMRESLDRKRMPNYSLVHVSPLRAAVANCSEVSSSFNESSLEGCPFYADLYTLILDQCSKQAKKKMEEMPFMLTETIFYLLRATRPMCFS